MKMFFKSNQRSMQMKMQRASQYMVFSTFKETVLLLLSLKVRTLNDNRIMLFWPRDPSFETSEKSPTCTQSYEDDSLPASFTVFITGRKMFPFQ